jgi:SAM-dependent methyltransferase
MLSENLKTRFLFRLSLLLKQTYDYLLLNRLLIIENVFRGVDITHVHSLLEIGSGEAYDVRILKEIKNFRGLIVALDINRYKVWYSIKKDINFIVADAHYLPFRSEIFDFVFLKDVLHHIRKNHKYCIKEALRVVRANGLLRIIEANRYHINPILVYKSDNKHDHFTLDQMCRLLRTFAFDEIYGYELLPSFSFSKKTSIIWNVFVFFFFILISSHITKKFIFLYLRIKEKFFKRYLTYYVLTKRKRSSDVTM